MPGSVWSPPEAPAAAVPEVPLPGCFDLSTRAGMALLRRFDAQLRRIEDPEAQRAAVRALRCLAPLSDRAAGLLVLPGGALALRQEQSVLVCDPASACGLTGPAAAMLRRSLGPGGPGLQHVVHGPAGLLALAALPRPCPEQAVTLVAEARALAALPGLPAPLAASLAEWRGPAAIRWGGAQEAAVLWEMVPAPARLALGASVAGDSLTLGGPPVGAEIWDAPDGDSRYQLLSSGLFAHLDELLGNEVSDLLRFQLVDLWTDGEESLASQLADGLGLLPACFAAPPDRPVGLAALAPWPRAMAAMGSTPLLLLGLAPEPGGPAWHGGYRQAFLRAARRLLAGQEAWLVTEQEGLPALPLPPLAADRQMRRSAAACAILAPLPDSPLAALALGRRLAAMLGGPVLTAAPGWGLCHRFDPEGAAAGGNAAWYGFGGGLEGLSEEG